MSRVGLILEICSVGFWHTGDCGDEFSWNDGCIISWHLHCIVWTQTAVWRGGLMHVRQLTYELHSSNTNTIVDLASHNYTAILCSVDTSGCCSHCDL